MELFFTPQRLKRVSKEIAVLHKSKNKLQDVVQVQADTELEHLIRSLVAMDEAELAMETFIVVQLSRQKSDIFIMN